MAYLRGAYALLIVAVAMPAHGGDDEADAGKVPWLERRVDELGAWRPRVVRH